MDSLGELLENVGVFEIRIFCANKLNANIYNFPSILCTLENQKMSDVIELLKISSLTNVHQIYTNALNHRTERKNWQKKENTFNSLSLSFRKETCPNFPHDFTLVLYRSIDLLLLRSKKHADISERIHSWSWREENIGRGMDFNKPEAYCAQGSAFSVYRKTSISERKRDEWRWSSLLDRDTEEDSEATAAMSS